MYSRNFVVINLTSGSGDKTRVPDRSGLNWGQRPGRNPDQAYLHINSEIQKSNFFPKTGVKFKVKCDDGEEIIMVRAQQNGKALQSSDDNSIMGKYFRKRIGLKVGSIVTLSDLLRYGRDSVEFKKLDEAEYFMDFSNKTD